MTDLITLILVGDHAMVRRGVRAYLETHVGNILSKLQLADRTQAAVYAWRAGLMQNEQLD